MNTHTLARPASVAGCLSNLWHEALRRERTLTLFALFMAVMMLPTLVALGLDDRQLRGVNVWVKPLKFMASLSLFSLSTAWFAGLLPPQQRRAWPMRLVVWTLLIAGTGEVGYISWQAALAEHSHYNRADWVHQLLYSLMGAGALALMLTQVVLAHQIMRHGDPNVPRFWRWSVVLALLMTFVLGTSAAFALAQVQPPSGAGVPVVGWHLGGADLRLAHFVGSHAQQFVPLVAWLLMCGSGRQSGRQSSRQSGRVARHLAPAALAIFCVAYTALWAWAFKLGLKGAVFLPPI